MNQLLSGVTEFRVQGVLIFVLESVFAVGTDHMYGRECESAIISGVMEFRVQGVLILIFSSHSALEQLLAEATRLV